MRTRLKKKLANEAKGRANIVNIKPYVAHIPYASPKPFGRNIKVTKVVKDNSEYLAMRGEIKLYNSKKAEKAEKALALLIKNNLEATSKEFALEALREVASFARRVKAIREPFVADSNRITIPVTRRRYKAKRVEALKLKRKIA